MKKAFMSLKFYNGEKSKKQVEDLTRVMNQAGIENVVMVRDVEKYGKAELPEGKKLMLDYAFPAMKECDMLVVEFSEKGVGLGIGAGYTYAIGKPIYVIAKNGSDISLTMQNLAKRVIFYNEPEDLLEEFKKIEKEV